MTGQGQEHIVECRSAQAHVLNDDPPRIELPQRLGEDRRPAGYGGGQPSTVMIDPDLTDGERGQDFLSRCHVRPDQPP